MAIDTAAKRKSISGIVLPFLLVGVTSDATPDAAWRQSAGWSYEGITASVPAVTPIIVLLRGETLSIPVIAREILAVPTHDRDTLSVPVHPPETLSC